MKYNTLNPFQEETLPWTEYIPEKADKLILGTFPTKKDKRDFDFFYPNSGNKFWDVLAKISGSVLSYNNGSEEWKTLAVQERKNILDKLNLGISDMGYVVLRQNNSSLDSNLFPIEFSDILGILETNVSINTVILTSSTKGNSALSWLDAFCKINEIDLKIKNKDRVYPKSYKLTLEDRTVKVVAVYSTSGAAAKTEEFLVEQYKEVLLDFAKK